MILSALAARVGTAMVAPWVKWAAIAAAIAGFGLWCYLQGANGVHEKWDAQSAKDEVAYLANVVRLAKAQERVVYQFVPRYHTVYERGKTIVKEVPKYITVESDRACTVPRGFARVHDAAAANLLPGAARDTDDAAAGIALSAVGETVAANYTDCNGTRETLMALQEWARGVAGAQVGND